ncbi:DUF5107 domain-containing protein [Tessaracoccus sp. SD287]|uniref:DUF5107 domain-containing protein n=1 Tax=Tessaracoccus sp. SD287 TaxID=2782008 RepID=UPI001A97304F|nr:DUF5107 domain-containing protein [Tessaracoccus sp. SD287]MBO1031275.1 DUF5107 domain-containing protein [Tessaracoccus sp. SD287]
MSTADAASQMITIEQRPVRAAGLDRRPGLPILHGGGGRLATAEEQELLGVDQDHADRPTTMLPYRHQAVYDRQPVEQTQRVAVLENEHLRATFLLDLGGRLWSLTDLDSGRELLHQADWVQPANLALRNAWFAGGVEWNLGVTGHWGLTCDPISAAIVEEDGVQVLRMWAYERLLELDWQLDVWLPAGASQLAVHVTLANPHPTDRPVYWWSNIAVPQVEGGRVLVEADSAFHFGYVAKLHRVPVPVHQGVDITRPDLARHSGDYFFETRAEHPWIAAVDAAGRGLAHASTSRLISRKLFVWGTASGGDSWQRWLSGEGAYLEIQAGLARTQLEHLRLPAGQRWTWTETYSAIELDPEDAQGDYAAAVAAAAGPAVDAPALDHAHRVLTKIAAAPVGEGWTSVGAEENQGWGALAVAVGDLPQNLATPYDPAVMDEEQRAWLQVAQTGVVGDELWGDGLSTGVIAGEGWVQRLRQADPGPAQQLMLGFAEHAAGDTATARELWRLSLSVQPSAAAARALALTGPDGAERVDLLHQAHGLATGLSGPAADELLVELLVALRSAGRDDEAVALVEGLSQEQRNLPRVQYLEAAARVAVGDAAGAGELLARPLLLPDLREGDLSLDQLWFDHQRLLGTEEPLPAHYDFRMFIEPGRA